MRVELAHAFVGCNRVTHALDWGPAGLVIYTAHNAVVLYDPKAAKILTTLLGHSGRVNCVRWLPAPAAAPADHSDSDSRHALASGAADGCLIVWLLQLQDQQEPWQIAARLQGHQGPVTGVALCDLGDGKLLLVSTAADDNVLIWSNNSTAGKDPAKLTAWHVQQRLSLPQHLQHSVAISVLPSLSDWLLLALGGVDNTVRLFLAAPGEDFKQICMLTGHGNWVRSLAFNMVHTPTGEKLLLASASQDKYIRIWGVMEEGPPGSADSTANKPAAGIARYAPKPGFSAGGKAFAAVLEALLIGHEDWVHSVAWQPGTALSQRPCLLSASMDRTMALWRPDLATGLWMSEESVGDAGPSSLGYFGGAWSPTGDAILAYGYTGALHLWQRSAAEMAGCQVVGWTPAPALGGHFGAVVDLAWSFDGSCLLTVSADQTARVTTCSRDGDWFEIARPQVHGHDFACAASLPSTSGTRFTYVSGSEEKVVRVLEAPQTFLDTLAFVRGARDAAAPVLAGGQAEERAYGAAVPALGLSNKALYASDSQQPQQEGPDLAPRAAPAAVSGRPLEEHLQQSTLWPEVYKVYGHGNELFCLAADPLGRFLASACRAQATDVAAIWIWRVSSWASVQQLEAHSLTVTQLAFSPDGSRLVSVSRDRSLAVWTRTEDEASPFQLVRKVAKAHARIIWSVACAADGSFFATGSRDNTVKLWSFGTGAGMLQKPIATLPAFQSSVQAVAFAPSVAGSGGGLHCLAVGLEDGGLQVLSLDMNLEGEQPQLVSMHSLWTAPPHMAHCGAVRRLCWRIAEAADDGKRSQGAEYKMQIASGSEDHSVHVYDVHW